jgi:hypothetical protein
VLTRARDEAAGRLAELAAPHLAELDGRITQLERASEKTKKAIVSRRAWLDQHPELTKRLHRLDYQARTLERQIDYHRRGLDPHLPALPSLERLGIEP